AATSSDTTLANVASGLATAVTGANYRALATDNGTVTLFRIDRAATTVSTTAPVATLGDAATWTETIQLGGTPTTGMVYAVGTKDDATTPAYDTYSVIAGSTDTLTNLTTSLTAALNASATYDAIATGNNTITILRGADTNAFSALTALGANPSDAAAWSEAVQVSDTVAEGQTYTVALKTASGAPTYFNYTATAIDTLDTVTTALSGLIDASSGYATLVTGASGSKVIHVLQQGGITGITSSTSLAAPATDAAAYAETVEVGGTVVARETWNITLTPSSGSPVTFSYVAGSGADTADAQTVAQRLAAQIHANDSYNATAFQTAAGTWVVAVSAQGGTVGFTATQSVAAAAPLVRPTLGGEAKVAWTQQVTLADGAGVDDVWTVRLDGTSGLSNYQLTGTTATSATAAAALAGSTGYEDLGTTGNVAKFRQVNSDFVTIGQRTWIDRLAPTATTAPAADSVAASARLTEYNFTLAGKVSVGDVWAIKLNGIEYKYTAAAGNNLNAVSIGLRAAINAGGLFTAAGSGADIKVTIKPGAWFTGFTQNLSQGGGKVRAVLDIDRTRVMQGVQTFLQTNYVPVYYFGFFGGYQVVTTAVNVSYIDTPVVTLRDASGNVVLPVSTNAGATTPDAGSTLLTDPLQTYELSAAGTYTVEVMASRQYLQANPFASNGLVGIASGQPYALNVSLQRHAVNEDAINLVGKQVTLTTGTNRGTTARILAYDAPSKTYTLDRDTTVGSGNRFDIQYDITSEYPAYAASSDTFQVVLTRAPTANVTLDVTPQITATYNSDLAFSARDNYGQTEGIQVDTATPQAKIELTGTPVADQVWRLALGGVNYDYTASAAPTLASVATGLKGVIDAANAGYTVTVASGTLTVSRYVGDLAAFTALLSILPYSEGSVAITQLAATPWKAALAFAGPVRQGEEWKVRLNNVDYAYTVQYGDDLGAVTLGLFEQLKAVPSLRVSLTGLELTVATADRTAPLAASYTIKAVGTPAVVLPAATAGATVTSQLVFSSDASHWNGWNKQQTVTVTARDDRILEGHDLKVFPAMGERINTIRGPLFIDGGAQYSDANALNEPFMTAGETNLVRPNSTIAAFGTTTATINGQATTVATLTDTRITHVDAARGEMPGLDPRMNDYAYQITVINAPGVGTPMDLLLGGLKGDTLAVKAEDGTSTLKVVSFNGPAGASVSVKGRGDAGTLYSKADIVLKGDVFKDSVWELNVGGTAFSYTAGSRPGGATADDALTLDIVALRLGNQIAAAGFTVVRTGFLLEISRAAPFAASFTPGKGNATILGTPASDTGVDWAVAEVKFAMTQPITDGQGWSVTLLKSGGGETSQTYTYTAKLGDDLTAVILGLADQIDISSRYHSDIKYETATFTTNWPASPVVANGLGYYITPLNRNFLAVEADQVDVLNLFNRASVSDDAGVLTDSRLTGFGMGGDTVVAGKAVKGGISYQGLEQLNLMLGSGNDRLTVESTHLGSTTITSAGGNDTITIKTVAGHTFVGTGAGSDVVNVGSDQNVVDQITGLLVISQGGDGAGDVLNVVDSGDENANTATLTQSTLTGMDMPTVAEVQTIRVQAKEGTFRLGLAPELYVPGAPYGAAQTITYDKSGSGAGVSDIQTKLRVLYGTSDLIVTEVGREIAAGETDARAITYALTFTGAKAGVDMPKVVWAEARAAIDVSAQKPLTNLLAYDSASVDVNVVTKREGSVTPTVGNVQTFAVDATGGTFRLTVNVPQPGSTTVLAQTTAAIAWNATADQIRTALDPILNPNGSILDPFNPRNDNSRPYTNNVAVTRAGNVVTLAFQGEHRGKAVTAVDTTALTGDAATIDVATRTSGINYYGVGTLNITLGSGDDIFNVQGTSAVTNLNTKGGADRIYVSSTADVNAFTGSSGFMAGNVVSFSGDDRPALQFELAESATSVSIEIRNAAGTVVRTVALGASAAGNHLPAWDGKDTAGNVVAAGAYSYSVTAKRSDDSTFAGTTAMRGTLDRVTGTLNIDAGSGINTLMVSDAGSRTADTAVLVTRDRISGLAPAVVNYVTTGIGGTYAGGITIWSGYAADTVTVTSTRQDSGPLVGGLAVRTVTSLNTGLGDDRVTVSLSAATDGFFAVNTQGPFDHDYLGTARTDDDTVVGSGSSLPLIVFGGQGKDDITGGSGDDILFGDRGRVEYKNTSGTAVQVLGWGGLGDMTDGLARIVSVARAADIAVGGNDFLLAGEGNNIVFGGANGGGALANAAAAGFIGDYLQTGAGSDILFGDNGTVEFVLPGLPGAGKALRYQTTDTLAATGGNDKLLAGAGTNTILGGMGADTIVSTDATGTQVDTILGDNGLVEMDAQGGNYALVRTLSRASAGGSLVDLGGNDQITVSGNRAAVVVLGGDGADTIDILGAGNRTILGDNGIVTYVALGQTGAGRALKYETTDTLLSTSAGG
ncbi:MAG: hypothetical protein NTW37_20745, partial [Proteobacteria bacterium]|nr:hypothetical protein [Pseudomonadota bacterium]